MTPQAQPKCYISGKITNLPEEVYLQKFAEGMEEVRAMNMHPVNPCFIPHDHDKSWQSYMKHDIIEMMKCDALYMLNNWQESRGAKIEWQIADSLGMKIFYQL
jgi:hypothetical protein